MTVASSVAKLSLSSLLCVVLAIPVALAQEHQRPETPRAEAPRAQGHPQARTPVPPRATVPPRPTYDAHGQVLDPRYGHGRYYPPAGTARPSLPPDYRAYYRGRDRYYFHSGVWYAPHGAGFVVVQPPVGLVIGVLPLYYSTVWFGGIPYYYANNVYYSWQPEQNGYAVVDPPDGAPPDGADAPVADAAAPPDIVQQDLIIYPKNGQSKDQQAADQYECHTWAKGQTGFDPTQPGDGADNPIIRSNYDRATSACLQARGYQVN
jgi:hypothetical protein